MKVRVATINYEQKNLASFSEFQERIEYFVQTAREYLCDYVLFPEFVTMPLLSISKKKNKGISAVEELKKYELQVHELFSQLAVKNKIHVIAGSQLTIDKKEQVKNLCKIYLGDGKIFEQDKIHITPSECDAWNVIGGNRLTVIPTKQAKIGVLICYDSEFPELSRFLVDQGIEILFVPFSTDNRAGFLRVHYSCQARAIENQIYVVTSGNVGNLKHVFNMDTHYAISSVLTPVDFAFARDGIAAEAQAQMEMMVVADLDLTKLAEARSVGTVRNLKDRRLDLYSYNWNLES